MAAKRSKTDDENTNPVKKDLGKPTRKVAMATQTDPDLSRKPDVIVDFEHNDGLISIVIENIGDDSAYNTSVRFNKKILGMQKTKDISSLRIFQSLSFLQKKKKIKMLVDSFQFYVACRQPMQITTVVSFSNKLKQTFQNSIQHDLSIYTDFTDVCSVKTT